MKNQTQQLKDLYDKLGEIIKGSEAATEYKNGQFVVGHCSDVNVNYFVRLTDANKKQGDYVIDGCFYGNGMFDTFSRLMTGDEIREFKCVEKPTPPITIDGHIVRFDNDGYLSINGVVYSRADIEMLHSASKLPYVNIVLFGQTCSKELLWEIINRLNE